ncbi:MAG: hypothetical protein KDD45_07435 [Bdellovibrionales bacterium]|nr:hypothetical protein [Bdellovibrionales bacterium]
MELRGNILINELQSHSGIEKSNFNYHFNEILHSYKINPDQLTIELLRETLAEYLQDLILETQEG